MRVSLCGTEASNGSIIELKKAIREVVSERSIVTFNSPEHFARRLRNPGARIDVAIIVVASRPELHAFIALEDLLDDVRVILVLLEGGTEVVIEAQQLRPRFIGHGAGDFPLVSQVLRKIIESKMRYPWQKRRR